MLFDNINLKRQYIVYLKNKVEYTNFWLYIITYSFGYLLLTYSDRYEKACIVVMGGSLIGIIYSIVKIYKSRFTNNYFKFTFVLFMIWQIHILYTGIHDFSIGIAILYSYIRNPFSFISYLVPLIVLIPVNIFFIKKMFDYFTLLTIPLFFILAIFFNQILFTNQNFSEQTVWTLGTGAGFLLLNWVYQKRKRKIIAISAILLSLFISAVMARRNIMLTFSNYIIFSVLLILFNSKQSIQKKISILFVLLLTISMIYYTFVTYQDKFFAKITGRIDDNTREGLFPAFFSDMTSQDLIYGKGFDGTYYAPGNEVDKDYRSEIECGYLQMLLKGGVINLVLFLLIAFPAIFLGFFKSNNIICKTSGTIVLLWLIDMFPWGMPGLSIRYILLWTCIGICYSKELRNLTETEIKIYLNAI